MKLNKLDFEFEFNGRWHIGIIVNKRFLRYVENQNISIDIPSSNFELDLIFLGKDHNLYPDNFVKIQSIYYNSLLINELTKYAKFDTDNPEYKIIDNCNFINLNGIWKAKISEPNLVTLLRQKF